MDPPFGHQHHQHHHQRFHQPDNEYEAPPPCAPTVYQQHPHFAEQPSHYPLQYQHSPPSLPVTATHVSDFIPSDPPLYTHGHIHHDYAPPPPSYNYGSDFSHVSHVSHEQNPRPYDRPAILEPEPHFHKPPRHNLADLDQKPTVKIYCKADPDFYLTIRDDKVVLAPADPSDEFQHWYKDDKYSTRVKDEESCPSFALVNKATGLAIKHAEADTCPVQLIPYNPDSLDITILWSQSKDMGAGYRAVRMVNNIRLNMDAFHGDKRSGGVHNGTSIVLWGWNEGDNQKWKIVPYCTFLLITQFH